MDEIAHVLAIPIHNDDMLRDLAASLCDEGGTAMALPDAGPVHDMAQHADEAWIRLRQGLDAAALPPAAAGLGAVAYAVERVSVEATLAEPDAVALSAARSHAGLAEVRVVPPAGMALRADELDRLHAALSAVATGNGAGELLWSRPLYRAALWTGGGGAAARTCLLWLNRAGEDAFVQAALDGGRMAGPGCGRGAGWMPDKPRAPCRRMRRSQRR